MLYHSSESFKVILAFEST